MVDSPTLTAARTSDADKSPSSASLPPAAAEPPKPKSAAGSMLSAYFGKKQPPAATSKSDGKKPIPPPKAAPPKAAPPKAASKPPPLSKPPAPTSGIKKPPADATTWMPELPADVKGLVPQLADQTDGLFKAPWTALSIEHRMSKALFLPFAGVWDKDSRPCLVVALTSDSRALGGGAVFLVSQDDGPGLGEGGEPVARKLEHMDVLLTLHHRIIDWAPTNPAHADPEYANLLWRLMVTFKGLEWECAHPRDIVAAGEGKFGADVFELKVAAPPDSIVKDLRELPMKVPCEDRKALIERCDAWSKTADTWDHGSADKPPFWPLLAADPRRAKVESRANLAAAALRILRSPSNSGMADIKKSGGIARVLHTLSITEARHTSPIAAIDDEDDAEAAETAELTAPPKPKPKPEAKPKPKKPGKQATLGISGGLFVLGEAEEGDPDDEEGDSSEDGFIDSDDDVEMGEEVAKKKANVKRVKNRECRHSVSGSGEEDSDDSRSGDDSDQENSMSDGSGSDEGSESSGDEDDDPIVKAKAQASEGSDDDEQPIKRKAPSGLSTAPPKKKRARVVEDEPEDDETLADRAALFAQQQMTSAPTKGKPDGKLGSKAHPLHAKANANALAVAVAAPPRPKPAPDTAAAPAPAPVAAPAPAHAPMAVDAHAKGPGKATDKRALLATRAEVALGKVAELVAEAKDKRGNVLVHSEGGPLDALEANTTTARSNMAKFVSEEGRAVDHVDKCINSLVLIIARMADAVQVAQKKPTRAVENAHISIGATGSQMLLEVLPKIEELQETINALAKKGSGMALRLAQEQASMLALERK